MNNTYLRAASVVLIALLLACSTEKNTLISRNYHGTTAHYNGYFNANDLLKEAMNNYRNNLKEDFNTVLPIQALPNEEEVKSFYTPIDTAVAKCTKVIQRHAMPSMDKPSQKKEEWNRWIDENWVTIGIANYYRRDYDLALKNFSYVNRFFAGDKSSYAAELWMARTYIQQGKTTEAGFSIAKIQKLAEADASGEKSDKKSKSKSSSKSKKKKEEAKEPDKFPKYLHFELALTEALLAEKKKDVDEEIKALEKACELAKKKNKPARLHFVLAQLYENKGDRPNAAKHYKAVLNHNPSYEMAFNASLKGAMNEGGAKVKSQLVKMLRDPKNAEFKDQIYYTLAMISKNEGDNDAMVQQLSSSAYYSTTNKRQKGQSYEKLGDYYFGGKEYYKAQKYYDSCARVIPETYPNYEGIKNKAGRLQNLVKAIETIQLEDSLQRIATMSESDRLVFAENVLEKMKADEKKRKEQEAARMAEIQRQQQQASANTQGGNKWYWNNPKTRQEGFEEFKRNWGQRENEDDWRRSDKIVVAAFKDPSTDTTQAGSKPKDPNASALDSLTAEQLLVNLPVGDSALSASRERLVSAHYDAGKIYQDQLGENTLAEGHYQAVLDKPWETNYKLLSSYQIYRMYPSTDGKALAQKDYILINYPTSDYAGYLRDPDYFIKKRELEKRTQQEYLTDLDRYERGLYYPVLTKANLVITEQKDNPYRAKYYLLKAHAQAKLNEDKKTLLPTLDELIAAYPNTDEAKKAKEMKDIIEKGYSRNIPADFSKKGIYTYHDGAAQNILIFLGENVDNNVAKVRVVDFNKSFFSKSKLNTSSKILGSQSVILVRQFDSEIEAADYMRTFKNEKMSKMTLKDMSKFKIIAIDDENMKLLFETQKLEDYQLFYDEFY